MVSRYTHQGYGEMFEHMDGDPVQPGDKLYYAEDDYLALAADQHRAFTALDLMGVPRDRAKSVDNGIFVLDQRHEREHESARVRIAQLEALLRRHPIDSENWVRDRDRLLSQQPTGDYTNPIDVEAI